MAKKLKKKIEEICGLAGLDWEERQEKANQILASFEWKQKLCNELVGLSFRELERALTGVATERQKKEDSYERKLALYSGTADGSTSSSAKNKRNSSRDRRVGPESASKNNLQRPKPPPRSLAEILAQVYAPREGPEAFKGREGSVMALFHKTSTEEDQDLFSRPDDENSES